MGLKPKECQGLAACKPQRRGEAWGRRIQPCRHLDLRLRPPVVLSRPRKLIHAPSFTIFLNRLAPWSGPGARKPGPQNPAEEAKDPPVAALGLGVP